MPIVKLIEVEAKSEKSWEEATQNALKEASETIRNIQSIHIKDLQAEVRNNEIVGYKIDATIAFEITRG